MKTHNPENERIKRRYLIHLKETKGRSEDLLDEVAKAISRYETYTRLQDFDRFNIEQVKGFKQQLYEQKAVRSGEPLSQATIYATLRALMAFFRWLAGQKEFRSRFSYGDWDYFSPMGGTVAIAKARRSKRVPTLDQVRHVLASMPAKTEIEKRNRALIAFVILTGARDKAVASFRLCHIDIANRLVHQDARVVRTKFRKTFDTWFFRVDDRIEEIFVAWVRYLVEEKGCGSDDPLFPATRVAVGPTGAFEAAGLDRKPWSDAGPIRRVFREAFADAGLPYFNPHSFRNTLVAHGRETCATLGEMQAWAQNLGHESLTTTFGSYGKIEPHEQAELIRDAGKQKQVQDDKLDQLISMVGQIQMPRDDGNE